MALRKVRVTQTTPWFVVAGPYTPEVVRAIRLIPGRTYEPGTRTWRIPKAVEPLQGLLSFAATYDPRAVPAVLGALQLSIRDRSAGTDDQRRPPWWVDHGVDDDDAPVAG